MEGSKFKPNRSVKFFLATLFENGGAESVVSALSFLDMAFVLSRDGKVIAVNDRFTNLIGYSHEELSGEEVLNLVDIKDRDNLQNKLSTNFRDSYSLDLLTKSRAIRHVTITPCLFSNRGRIHRLAGFVDNTDIINLKNAQIHHLDNIAKALISAIEVRDPYTIGHMSRTAQLSMTIAEYIGLPKTSMRAIQIGASLHDVGKSAVPIEILVKPTKLEPHEWAFIKKHPEIGHKMLSDVGLEKLSTDIVLLHHECWDGSGYPYGLSRDEIPIEVSVVHTADSLEAIAGIRPYRKAYSFEEAIQIMQSCHEKYHPDILDICANLVSTGKFSGREYTPIISSISETVT